MTLLLVVPAMAQPKEGCECVFAPKAGQWQFNFNIGRGDFFNDLGGLYYMLPDEDGTATGLGLDIPSEALSNQLGITTIGTDVNKGLGNDYLSGDLQLYLLNTGSLNYTNVAFSMGTKYFITDHININLSGAYILNLQPSKNFVEGESTKLSDLNFRDLDISVASATVNPGDIYAQKAILGAVTNRLMVQLGSEYYFHTRNERIFPYVGVFGQFKMARIESFYPAYTGQYIETDYYKEIDPLTGEVVKDEGYPDMAFEELDLYRVPRAGQALGFGGGINFGVEFAVFEGLSLGIEVAPVCYQYTLLHLQVAGQDPYYTTNHNLRAFAFPSLTIGYRF